MNVVWQVGRPSERELDGILVGPETREWGLKRSGSLVSAPTKWCSVTSGSRSAPSRQWTPLTAAFAIVPPLMPVLQARVPPLMVLQVLPPPPITSIISSESLVPVEPHAQKFRRRGIPGKPTMKVECIDVDDVSTSAPLAALLCQSHHYPNDYVERFLTFRSNTNDELEPHGLRTAA